jgi:hypothetical protein
MLSKNFAGLVFLGTLCFLAGPSLAEKSVITISSNDVASFEADTPGLGDYYVMGVELPPLVEGQEILSAMLEFRVDAQGIELIEGYVNDTPRIEIYALTNPLTNRFDPSCFRKPAMSVMNVPSGYDRSVKVDVTEAIRCFADDPSTNHGFVVGSLTGSRDGAFSLKNDAFGTGTVGKLTIHFRVE